MNEYKKTLAIDIGGTNIKYGIVNEKYNFIWTNKIATDIYAIYKSVEEIIQKHLNEFDSIAISTTGAVDSINKKIAKANSKMQHYTGVNFLSLEKKYQKPLVILNDANAAAYSEKITNHKLKNYALITFGTGVGVGIIIDNKLFEGSNFLGGELGYLRFNKKLLDDYLSFSLFNKNIKEAFGFTSNEKEKWNEAYQNNLKFKKKLNKYLTEIAEFLSSISIILNLDEIKIGGGISYLDHNYIQIIFDCFYKHLSITPFLTKISLASFKNDAGMLGAIYFLRQ